MYRVTLIFNYLLSISIFYHACFSRTYVVFITVLSDGMHCLVPYTSGKIYQCDLDGAVYNITDIDTVPTPLPDTTTTTQRTTTTTVRPTGTTTQRTTDRTHGTSHKTTKYSHGSTTSLQSMITTYQIMLKG